MRNFTKFLASRDVLKQKNLYNIRQAKALLEPTGRKAIARPAVKKESSVFPRDMSDSLPPYVSQDPMTPGLVDLERKKVAYLRRKDEVAAGIEGKAPKTDESANNVNYYVNSEGKALKEKDWGAYKKINDMITNGQTPSKGSLNNVEARIWYLSNEEKFFTKINTDLSWEAQARQAFELRNSLRTQTRELMSDRATAERLTKDEPNMTWNQIVDRYRRRGKTGDEIFQAIVDSSRKSRSSLNRSLL